MSTITTLNQTDNGVTSRTTINTNFTNLNTDKQEKGSGVTGNIVAFGASNVLQDTGKVAPTGTIVGTSDTQSLSNKTLLDTTTLFANTLDATKLLGLSLSGATTGTKTTLIFSQTANRSITFFDATDTIVGKATTDILTNKTYDTAGAGNVFKIAGVQLTAVTGTGSVALSASPAFTGTPTAPTQTAGDNSTAIATTAWVKSQGYVSAAGGQVTATASGSLASGDRVILNSDGTVSTIVGRNINNGTATNFPTTTLGSIHGAYDAVSGKVVIAYQTDPGNTGIGKCTIGTVSGTTISFGTEVTFNNGFTNNIAVMFRGVGSSKVVIAFCDYNQPAAAGQQGGIICGTISGTTITFGSKVAFNASTVTNNISLDWDSTSSKGLVTFNSASTALKCSVFTESATVLTVNAAVSIAAVNSTLSKTVWTGTANVFVVAYNDVTNSAGKAVVQTVSGTTSSSGTPVTFNAAATGNTLSMVWDTSTSRAVIAYEVVGTGAGTVIIGTVSGTAISFGSPVTFATGTISMIGVGFDSTNGKIQVGYYDGTNSNAIEGAVSGTSITFASPIQTTAGRSIVNDCCIYAGNSMFVHLFSGTCSGQCVGSFYSNMSTTNFLGFSAGAYTNGTTATINAVSGSDSNQSGLTPGAKYYVQNDGTLTSSSTSSSGQALSYAGLAMSATRILVKG